MSTVHWSTLFSTIIFQGRHSLPSLELLFLRLPILEGWWIWRYYALLIVAKHSCRPLHIVGWCISNILCRGWLRRYWLVLIWVPRTVVEDDVVVLCGLSVAEKLRQVFLSGEALGSQASEVLLMRLVAWLYIGLKRLVHLLWLVIRDMDLHNFHLVVQL